MHSALQKSRPLGAFGTVAVSADAAGVRVRDFGNFRERPVFPDRDDRLERVVDGDAEKAAVDAHAIRIDRERVASRGDGEGLSEFARDRIALIRAHRRACDEARAERENGERDADHDALPSMIELRAAETERLIDAISRARLTEAAALVGFLVFILAALLLAMAFTAGGA